MSSPGMEPLPLRRIAEWVRGTPSADAVRFLGNGDEVTERIGYADLWEESRRQAAALAERGLSGRPAILVFDAGIEFISALLGCLIAGVIAVPLPVPRQERSRRRFLSVLEFLQPGALLTTGKLAQLADIAAAEVPVVCCDELITCAAGVFTEPSAASPAIIQFSSGSTGEPRGIVITHGNIGANLTMIHHGFRGGPGDVCVSWLPHHHDMGLFGTILAPLTVGGVAVLMPPEAFLRRPLRWLKALSDHRAGYAGGPDFGYALCSRRIAPEAMDKLDLSAWRVAFVGGEPSRPETLGVFARLAARAGFREESFLSCYGLAEATLLCSSGRPSIIGTRVTCGPAAPGCRVKMRELPPDVKIDGAEICIAGEHVSPGVWSGGQDGQVLAHAESFIAKDGIRYLPTGDIGTFEGDELVILDRLKDILPVRGGAIGPTEIESLVLATEPRIEAVAAVRGSDERPDSVRIAVETELRSLSPADCAFIATALNNAVAQAFGVQAEITLHPRGSLPRTTSGKIQRFATRRMLLAMAADANGAGSSTC